MKCRKLLHMAACAVVAMLPLAGCSGDSNPVSATNAGKQVTVDGTVDKTVAKSVAAATGAYGQVQVFNAYSTANNSPLGTVDVKSGGTFNDLKFTLPNTKSVVVFKYVGTTSTLRNVTPMDLTPPVSGVGLVNNAISISISSASEAIADNVAKDLGLAGKLGDVFLGADKAYATVAASVAKFGGQVLAYVGNSIVLTGNIGTSGPVVKVSDLTPEQWSDLSPKGEIIGVPTINGTPKVAFKITDANGNPVVGVPLGKMSFAIAKLAPGANGAPSQWLNYNVVKVGATPADNSGKYPSVEKDGTLVDNGDGTYEYTFKLDITKVKGMVDGLADSGNKRKADLGDLTYDPKATHRLVVGVSATSPKSADWAYSMKNPYEKVIDFVPGALDETPRLVADTDAKRDITTKELCFECHSGTKRFAAHHATRQDPRYCMVCHNEQVKFGSAEAVVDANGNYDGKMTNIINGFAVGNFTTFIHKIHMGTKLSKTGYNFEDAAVNVPAMNFEKVKYPQDIRNCATCHKNSAATPQGDNWNSAPSRAACGSCHDNINFATGANSKAGGAAHFKATNDASCAMCHDSAYVKAKHALPANADVSKRTMQPTVTDVKIDDATGKVTAYFTVTNNDQPVTSQAGFIDTASGGGPYPQFTLTKLVTGADGATKWVSYTNRFRTKTAGMAPVLQAGADTDVIPDTTKPGKTKTIIAGTFADVDTAKGQYSYTFGLTNSSVAGDIRQAFVEANVDPRSMETPVSYTGPARLALPADYQAYLSYDNTATHRVTMSLSGAKMKKSGVLDFVPNGANVTKTRNIVTMAACDKCHAGKSMHRGYDIELCVACHTQDTKDSMTGQSVDLQHFVHKLHMGRNLPSVKAGGEYRINSAAGGTYDFTNLGYPGAISNCSVCHVEGTGAPANAINWCTTPTANACITCHDGTAPVAHATQNANACATCHGSGKVYDAAAMHK